MLHEPFPIVGVGASAGGIEALEILFQDLPPDSGMAFVVVTHLPDGYETTLPAILGHRSTMAITIAGNGQMIEPNHVYVGPSGPTQTIKEGRLVLSPRGSGPVVDALLHSLAEDRGEQAIGIVLSGSGSDGAVGIGTIKEAGGFTIAQGPAGQEPAQTSMPGKAIATGLVDMVLPIEEMAHRLIQLARSRLSQDGLAEQDKLENKTEEVDEAKLVISRILEKQLGHDFSGYKGKAFIRRVLRRMQITQFEELALYIERLRGDPEEVTALFSDLLIGVTHFFRDSEAFAALEKLVIPRLKRYIQSPSSCANTWTHFAVPRSCRSSPPISTRGRSPSHDTAPIRTPCCKASRSGALTDSSASKRAAIPSPRKSGTFASSRPTASFVIRRFRALT
jgi:two-component system CheB/CheR fusion protein